MSRSKRKHPIITDRQSAKWVRTLANKKLRRKYHYNYNNDDTIKGGTYKKFFEQWDIHDFAIGESKQEAIRYWQEEEIEALYSGDVGLAHSKFKTFKNYIRWWKTHYLYK